MTDLSDIRKYAARAEKTALLPPTPLQDPAIAAIPVLLLTGAGTAAKSIDELHVAGTIEKPVELDTLLAEVAHYCA